MESGIELGAQDGVEALGGEGSEEAIVEGAGGMDDGGERVVERDGVQQGFEGAAVGGIAGGEGDGSACRFELAFQGLGARCVGALT